MKTYAVPRDSLAKCMNTKPLFPRHPLTKLMRKYVFARGTPSKTVANLCSPNDHGLSREAGFVSTKPQVGELQEYEM